MKKPKKTKSRKKSISSSSLKGTSRSSISLEKPKRPSITTIPTPAPVEPKKHHQKRLFERQKLVEEIIAANAPPPPPPEPEEKPHVTLKDATTDLAEVPYKLELHPMKTAPSLAEVKDRITREQEHEKLKYFTVPIKIYEPQDKSAGIDLKTVDFGDEDRAELDRYGSRVVMRQDGRVAAMEVQQEVMDQFKKKKLRAEICECTEKDYEVSEKLKNNPRVRRLFMAKVLALECILRSPSVLVMYGQKEFAQLHDFIYQQTLLIFFMIAIVQGTRLAGIYFSDIGRYEPCRTIITVLTMSGYCMISVLLTALLRKHSIKYIEYMLYEDPTSLETLQAKLKSDSGRRTSYPYVLILMIGYLLAINLTLAFLLIICNKRIFNELGNGFIFIVLIMSSGLCALSVYFILVVRIPFFTATPIGWDSTQILFSYLFSTKWLLWRFYMLQLVVKGKVMKVDESMCQFVALNFAI